MELAAAANATLVKSRFGVAIASPQCRYNGQGTDERNHADHRGPVDQEPHQCVYPVADNDGEDGRRRDGSPIPADHWQGLQLQSSDDILVTVLDRD